MAYQVKGLIPKIYSAFCNECEQVREVSPSKLFCEKCGKPLRIHVMINSDNGYKSIVSPVLVKEILTQNKNGTWIEKEFSFHGKWRTIYQAQGKSPKVVLVMIEGHGTVECEPDDVFLELEGAWGGQWA